MAGDAFQTNKIALGTLLRACHDGTLQLPDFQRSWVWDEDRIKSLIASISRSFPVGALMTLERSTKVNFKPRPVEGAPDAAHDVAPDALLLDGQQRMTSLYQVTLRNQVVETVTPKLKRVKRWFYIDICKAIDPEWDREDAIVGMPEDRMRRGNFAKDVEFDLSTREREFNELMYPLSLYLIGILGRWSLLAMPILGAISTKRGRSSTDFTMKSLRILLIIKCR